LHELRGAAREGEIGGSRTVPDDLDRAPRNPLLVRFRTGTKQLDRSFLRGEPSGEALRDDLGGSAPALVELARAV
jgi:hypothetical protein